jgi:hypothetical protein
MIPCHPYQLGAWRDRSLLIGCIWFGVNEGWDGGSSIQPNIKWDELIPDFCLIGGIKMRGMIIII